MWWLPLYHPTALECPKYFSLPRHVASGIFPGQEWNLCPLHWEHGILTSGLPGKSQMFQALNCDMKRSVFDHSELQNGHLCMVLLNTVTVTVVLSIGSQCPAQITKHNERSANVDHCFLVRLQFEFSCLMANISRNLFDDRNKVYKEEVSWGHLIQPPASLWH